MENLPSVYMAEQPEENMKQQLQQLVSNETLKTMFPNLNTLASISLSVSTCSYCFCREEFFPDEVNQDLAKK